MGGLTSSPQAPAAPAPTPVVDTTVDETQQRLDALERRRRGRGGMIQTSERGLVTPNAKVAPKKSLLGE